MDEKLLTAVQASIKRTDELHAQHVAELQRTIASLHEVLHDIATAALKLADMPLPSDSADRAAVTDVIYRTRNLMAYLEPPSHLNILDLIIYSP